MGNFVFTRISRDKIIVNNGGAGGFVAYMKLGETGNNVILENGKMLDPGIEYSKDEASWLLRREKPLVGIWKNGKDGDQWKGPERV